MEFRKLRADEIEARISQVSAKGCGVLLYKNARCDMAILDETVGQFGWQRDHKELKDNMYCGIGIYDKDSSTWIWKWDCGKESYTEAEKGEASDSFKRAGFNWGIGRELYTAPFIWFKPEQLKTFDGANRKCTDSFKVNAIEYKDNKISYIEVEDTKSKAMFTWGKSKGLTANNLDDLIDEEQYKELLGLIEQANVNKAKLLEQYNTDTFMTLTRVQFTALKKKLEKAVDGKQSKAN